MSITNEDYEKMYAQIAERDQEASSTVSEILKEAVDSLNAVLKKFSDFKESLPASSTQIRGQIESAGAQLSSALYMIQSSKDTLAPQPVFSMPLTHASSSV